MCGIAGFADFSRRNDEEALERMTATLRHRGPDGSGAVLTRCGRAEVGLGHRRLSIIDLSHHADQPMHFDGLSVVFNGEIYNYAELRSELSALGHTFQTQSDTEVVLHSWREWGEAAVQRWHGMFALTLLDSARRRLICVRDRAGVKPLFYAKRGDLFLFGSELKSLAAHPGFSASLDPVAASTFLQYGYVPGPLCILQDAQKLLPGHLLRVDLDTGELTHQRYWNVYDAYNASKTTLSLAEAVDETAKVLQRAFEYRLVADVPVGVFLSGGYDSTCVTALLQKDRTQRLKTFTIGMPDAGLDEAPFARRVAEHLGTDHTEYYCEAKDALDIIPSLPHFYDEPFADSSAIPTILVSRIARRSVTVALSADGGDELFAGYNRYDYIQRYAERIQAVPASVRNMLASLLRAIPSERLPLLRSRPNFHARYGKLAGLLADPSPQQLLKSLTSVFSPLELRSLLSEPVVTPRTQHDSTELRTRDADALSFMMAVDFQTYLVDDILQKVDRATMSVALEGREPFLDQSVIWWAARLPNEYKYRNGTKKFILREIVHRHVPKSMMDRPKMGFGIPIHTWLTGPLRPLVMDLLSERSLARHGLFVFSEVRKLVNGFYAGRTELHLKLWHLLTFQMWHAAWLAPGRLALAPEAAAG